MLPTVNSGESRLSVQTQLVLACGGLMALALPLVFLVPAKPLLADDPQPQESKPLDSQPQETQPDPFNLPAPGPQTTNQKTNSGEQPAAAPPVGKTYSSESTNKSATDATVEFLPPLSPNEQKLLDALSQTSGFDFTEMPLSDALHFLRDKHSISIHSDVEAWGEAGVGADTVVTATLEGVPLRSALRLLLKPLQLTAIIHDDVLLVTTDEKASATLVTRTYPVGDLAINQDYEGLCNTITNAVDAASWDEVGGMGSISAVKGAGSLVITQTHMTHDKVLELLRSLRSAKKQVPIMAAPREAKSK